MVQCKVIIAEVQYIHNINPRRSGITRIVLEGTLLKREERIYIYVIERFWWREECSMMMMMHVSS